MSPPTTADESPEESSSEPGKASQSGKTEANEGAIDTVYTVPYEESYGDILSDYNPAKDREVIRGVLAVLSIVLICVEVLAFIAMAWCSQLDVQQIKELIGVIFPPSIALASTASAFYFANHKS
jgi:hypothetical protein